MIWVFILATLAFVLGGVLAVRPTKAQQRVAGIREAAIRSGFHVKLSVSLKFPEGIETRRLPYYCKHLTEKKLYNSFYCAFRDGDHVQTSSGDISTSLKKTIDDVLVSANQDIQGFYLGDGLVGFSWLESDNQEIFDELCACVERVQVILREQS